MGGDPEPCTEDTATNIFLVWGGAQEPQSGFLDGGVGRGGAGGVIQFIDKVVDVPVVWVFFVVAAQLLDKAADVPVAVPPRFLFGVKCVGDVLTGRWSWVLTCLLVSRASMTCLLDVVDLFVLVKCVGDVLAGRGAGC